MTDSSLQIRVYLLDGSAQTIVQNDPDIIDRTLVDLHPATVFSHDRAIIAEDGAVISLVLPLVTRIDLLSQRLSVWDFPFVLGALVEITEAEFRDGMLNLDEWDQPRSSRARPVYLDLEMVDGQCVYLWMEVVAGMPRARLSRVRALLKEKRLVFGLRTGGIGLLNLSNIARFSVHPEPDPESTEAATQSHSTQNSIDIERPHL